jgi:hypothetical protein
MTGRSPHPDPDGHHDDLDPSDAARLTLLVPDDARALEADRLAWLAEEHDARTAPRDVLEVHQTWRVDSGPPRRPRRRLAIIAGATAVAVLGMSVIGAALALIAPRQPAVATAPATRLASGANDPGQLGGPLPTVTLAADANTVAGNVAGTGSATGTDTVVSTDLRPGVVAIVPAECADCSARLTQIAAQAGEYRLPVYLVGAPGQEDQLQGLADALTGHPTAVLIDPSSTLRRTYQTSGSGSTSLLLLLVRPDGRLYTVVDDPGSGVRLESSLVQIGLPTTSH